jgi:hypothetical protein
MFEAYTVAVRLSLVNQVSAGLLTLSQQFMATDAAAKRLQQRMDSIKAQAKTGMYLFGGGAALAAPFIYAIDKAAEFQKQLLGIQYATHGTTEAMQNMRRSIEGIAGQTVFSVVDVAKMAKIISTGNAFSAQQVSDILPIYARFADVQLLMKGTPYTQSVTEAVRLAHIAQHYDPASLTGYLDLLTKASMVVPGGLGELGNALKYSQGMGKTALGIDDQNMIILTALLNRLGFSGSRGGTNTIAAMVRSIPGIFGSGLLKGKSSQALAHMGMIDAAGHSKAFVNGKFDPVAWMGLLGTFVNRDFATMPEALARQDIVTQFTHAFGVMGNRVTSLLSSPQAISQFQQIGQQFQQAGGVEMIQRGFQDQSVSQQWMNAKTNFTSAMIELGTTLLPTATVVLKKLNTELQKLIEWMATHQDTVRHLALAFLGLSGAMMFGGTVLLLTAAMRGLGLALQILSIGGISKLGANLGALAGSMGGLLGAVGGLGLALGAGYAAGSLIWHFTEGTKTADLFGKAIAHVFAFFGDKEAQEALRLNSDWSGSIGHGKPSLGMQAAHASGADWVGSAGRYVSAGRKTEVHVHTQINMDGKKVGRAVTKHLVDSSNAPQTGLSSFDPSLSLIPAGSGGG